MKKNNLISFLSVLIISSFFISTVFAEVVIKSPDNQSFSVNQASVQLRDITITDDINTSKIKQGYIKITIPNTLSMIFDNKRSKDNVVIWGSAVTNNKVDERPVLTFENKDKTIVIPIKADFSPGETMVITKLYVKGFHTTSINSDYLTLSINNQAETYKDQKYLYIVISSVEDSNEPQAPSNLTVSDFENGVKLTWIDPTDLDIKGVQILRGKNSVVNGTPYTEVGINVQEFIDNQVKNGDTIHYILRAVDTRNNVSTLSEEITFVVGSGTTAPKVEEEIPAVEPETTTNEETVDTSTEPEATTEEPKFCTLDYTPVCGVDGVTYSNKCSAEKDNVEIAHEGECKVEKKFSDIEKHWAKENIEKMSFLGIVNGNPDGTFAPDNNLNRAEASAILFRVLEIPAPEKAETKSFSDVPLDVWYTGQVSKLKELQLIAGYKDGTFKPENSINRAEFLTLAMNIYYYLAPGDEKAKIEELKNKSIEYYVDIESKDWYKGNVTAATELEFVNGSPCGDYKCYLPEANITRAEATAILYRMFAASLQSKIE